MSTCNADYNPPVPSPQIFPVQETDARPGRPVPYQLNAVSLVDCTSGSLRLDMSNSGAVAVHYAIYANAFRSDGPWQYDVPGGAVVSDLFDLAAGAGGSGGSSNYDLTCYGPNGFQRRFAGSVDTNCNLIEVTSRPDANADALVLTFTNGTSGSVTFTATDGFELAGPWAFTLPAGGALTNCFTSVSANAGWYDLTVVADVDSTFVRRFAGHIEIGSAQVTGSRPARPTLSIAFESGNVRLKYPQWAGAYFLESASDPINGPWTTVRRVPMIEGENLVVTLALTTDAAFFRLRR